MIKAVGHRVLVEPFEVETETKSGIKLVVNEDREFAAQEYGTIIDIGPDAWKDFGNGNRWAEVGDKIIYSRYGGKIVRDPNDARKFVILNDEDVLARFEEE